MFIFGSSVTENNLLSSIFFAKYIIDTKKTIAHNINIKNNLFHLLNSFLAPPLFII